MESTVLKCYKRKDGSAVWADDSGKIWAFHPVAINSMGSLIRLATKKAMRVSDVMPIVKFGDPNDRGFEIPELDPREAGGVFLPTKDRIPIELKKHLDYQSDVMPQEQPTRGWLPNHRGAGGTSQSQQAQQGPGGGGFINDIVDRIGSGDIDIVKTVGDVRSIVDAIKGGTTPTPPPPFYVTDPNNGGSRGGGGTVQKDNTLLYVGGALAVAGVVYAMAD